MPEDLLDVDHPDDLCDLDNLCDSAELCGPDDLCDPADLGEQGAVLDNKITVFVISFFSPSSQILNFGSHMSPGQELTERQL